MIKLKDEVDYNETFVEAYAESDGEVSIELAPSVAADQDSEIDGENLTEVAENVESPVVTSSQVLRDFSLRSESRSSQSSYSDTTFVAKIFLNSMHYVIIYLSMTFDQYLGQLDEFLNNQKQDYLG